MKKYLSLLSVVFVGVMLLSGSVVHAADALPPSAVWFTPSTAAVGNAITLNALVYNSQSADATVTVEFSDAAGKIAIGTGIVSAQSAKTISASWTMPKANTMVTATVTAAVNSKKQSIPALLGVLGTVTIGNTPAPLMISGVSFAGLTQINGWLGPIFSSIEHFRTTQAAAFAHLHDTSPANSVTALYASIGLTLFSNQLFFYVAGLLLLLLVLRFIVNLIF